MTNIKKKVTVSKNTKDTKPTNNTKNTTDKKDMSDKKTSTNKKIVPVYEQKTTLKTNKKSDLKTNVKDVKPTKKTTSSTKKHDYGRPDLDVSWKNNKIFKCAFLLKDGTTKKFRLRISKSNIPQAGMGVFAVDSIPMHATGKYRGTKGSEDDVVLEYSWKITKYDKKTGEPDYDAEPLYYKDAYDLSESNWTRFVNCHLDKKTNNVEPFQYFDDYYYMMKRDIEVGEELYVYYGDEYVEYNILKTKSL
jgi:hypothetical protein